MKKENKMPKGLKWLAKRMAIVLIVMPMLAITLIMITLFVTIGKHMNPLSMFEDLIKPYNEPVIGDLGGIPVSIPYAFADRVHYYDDRDAMTHQSGTPPERTFQSKLSHFVFRVMYPDMTPTTGVTLKSTPYNTMSMIVSVGIDKSYNDLSMQSLVDVIYLRKWDKAHADNDPSDTWKDKYGYKRLNDHLNGLVVNKIYDYDDIKSDAIPGNVPAYKSIYYHINETGKIDTYIECLDLEQNQEASTCEQIFLLNPASGTKISVRYRIELLSHWQDIRKKVTDLILGFSVNTNSNTSNIK